MKRYNVLVTGVGAIIGYGIIKSLRASGLDVNIVGMDIFADAVGRHWCDSFVKAVPAAADNYAHFMRSLIETHDIDLVLPGIEQDMYRLNSESGAFDGLKVKLALNNRELIELSRDKWDTYRKLKSSGFRVIDSLIDSDFNTAADALGTPMLIKPRRSYASKGIKIISDE
ncbi:MAG TPA: carbamoyl-phosphate synthase subunit L, partial [bacterium]|nr:carbamoyl-phosphate synthase subunit L [bacterium]